ncbi:MAG: PIN domain-containing protein [Planctomycetota bacterium]
MSPDLARPVTDHARRSLREGPTGHSRRGTYRGSPDVGLVIDSTVFINAERERETPEQLVAAIGNRFGDVGLALSVMSAGELLHGCWRADSPSRRARREEFVAAILAAIPVVPITMPIMRILAEIDAKLIARGRRLPTSDLLIASTALARGDEVVTGNRRHFKQVPGLSVRELR